jgi:magnesium chelatase subunit ChlI-like protein
VLESLRQPLEDGSVVVSRAAGSKAVPPPDQVNSMIEGFLRHHV